MHTIREQFMKDMQAAGLSEATQERYVKNVDLFFKSIWRSPEEVTEAMVQDFIIGNRSGLMMCFRSPATQILAITI